MNQHSFEYPDNFPTPARTKMFLTAEGLDFDQSLFIPDGIFSKYKNKSVALVNNAFHDYSSDKSRIPSDLVIAGDDWATAIKVRYNPNSNILVKNAGQNFFEFFDKTSQEKLSICAEGIKKPTFYSLKNSKDEPISNYVSLLGQDRIGVAFFEGCDHWYKKNPCHFCDSCFTKRDEAKSNYPTLNTLYAKQLSYKEWWEKSKDIFFESIITALKSIIEKDDVKPHRHLSFIAGNLIDVNFEWELIVEVLEKIHSLIIFNDFDSYLNVTPPPKESRDRFLKRIKDLGINKVQFHLEVAGKAKFKRICRGKNELSDYDDMVSSLTDSVKIFGRGNARNSFVIGLQPIQEVIEEARRLAELGICPDYTIFAPKKGTAYQNRSAPTLKDIIEVSLAFDKIYKEYDFSPLYCALGSRSQIMSELYHSEARASLSGI